MYRTNCAKIFTVPEWNNTTTKTYNLGTTRGAEQCPINLNEIKGICFIYVPTNNEYYRLISDTTSGTTRTLIFSGARYITITINNSVMTVEFSSIGEYSGDIVELENRVNTIELLNENIVNPDKFTGTDNEKLLAAFDEIGDNNNGIVIITRKYTLSEDLLIKHSGSTKTVDGVTTDVNAFIYIIGTGNESIIDTNSHTIKGYNSSKSYGQLIFKNILFTGTGTCFNTDHLLRVFFDNCIFDGYAHVIYTIRFAQTLYFNQCIIRGCTDYIVYSENTEADSVLIDVRFTDTVVEHSKGFISGGLHGVYVTGCCIEGNEGVIVRGYKDCNLIFKNNYVESQNTGYAGGVDGNGLCFDFTNITGYYHNINISDNRFMNLNYQNEIIHIPSVHREGFNLVLINNMLSYAQDTSSDAHGAYLLVIPDNTTDAYTGILLLNNSRANIKGDTTLIETPIDTKFKAVETVIESNMDYVKNNSHIYAYSDLTKITSGSDLNNYTELGNYVSTSSTITGSLSNCPVSNIGFRLCVENMISANSIVQIIITASSTSRIFYRYCSNKTEKNYSAWRELQVVT